MSPNTESQLRNEATRGMAANELIANELLIEAFAKIDARIMQEWADSPARDTTGRENLWTMKKLLSNLSAHIAEVATTGKLASLQLEQERTLVQKAKEWAREVY